MFTKVTMKLLIQISFEKLKTFQEHHKGHIYQNHNVVDIYWMIYFSEASISANMATTSVPKGAVTKHPHPSTYKAITLETKEQQRTWSGLFKSEFIVRQKSKQRWFICVDSALVHATHTELYVTK